MNCWQLKEQEKSPEEQKWSKLLQSTWSWVQKGGPKVLKELRHIIDRNADHHEELEAI